MSSGLLKFNRISATSRSNRRGMVASIGTMLLLMLVSLEKDSRTNAFLSPVATVKTYHRQTPNQQACQHLQQLQHRSNIDSLLIVRNNNRYPQKRDEDYRLFLFRNIFRRNNKNNNKNDDDEDDDKQNKVNDEKVNGTADKSLSLEKDGDIDDGQEDEEPKSRKRVLSFFTSKSSSPPEKEEEENTIFSKKEKAIDAAKGLKAQAERVRLEAEKLDIILTLDKIAKLERELGSKSASEDSDRRQAIRVEIETLQKKLRGDTPTTDIQNNGEKETKDEGTVDDIIEVEEDEEITAKKEAEAETELTLSLSSEEIQERISTFKSTPKFMQQIVARAAGMDMLDDNFNITSLILQLEEDDKKYLGQFDSENGLMDSKPTFTEEQIEQKVSALKNVPKFVKMLGNYSSLNDTDIALDMLNVEWEEQQLKKKLQSNDNNGDSSNGDEDKNNLGGILEKFNNDGGMSDEERMVETLFPKSTRKDENFDLSDAQIKSIIAELAKDKVWQSSASPTKVPGGFIIRGTPKYENGDELMDAIDKKLSRSSLGKKISIFYVYDPTPVTEEQMEVLERPPVLFITAPDVARDPEFLQRTTITALAIGTTWYAALYPFLMNDKIMKLAEEQTALADASMPSDLSWLTDSSFPLFLAFIGTQIAHELGHRAVAAIYKLDVTIPTFVPSLVTGVTNSITSFKAPPKNRQQLLDFAIAGPLAGIAVSLAVLFYGLAATATMDSASYSNLPALPLEFVRQSTLGGAIIEGVLGAGTLDIPEAARGTPAVDNLFVPLHPFAIAGYLGLLVNTISLWPVGRTDGGRISMALFGRSGTQLVGLLALIVLFVAGLMNSDLFLFYFSYLAFFQSELEIPQRNEVDEADFSRVLLATVTGVLVVLTLVPM